MDGWILKVNSSMVMHLNIKAICFQIKSGGARIENPGQDYHESGRAGAISPEP
jgi:hypothetical protein